ncbi:Fur-regulated basic protein FbpA [Bacillus massiliigorillae]|uniref:Fur-regulated basic protein FbpA n=1 Tax=Bacillus massiliigorillae TaxID=1243664 RepID=UPI000399F0B7|nr:Fur-regulated basic protein FbpA [Bacillus massiliigorillae]
MKLAKPIENRKEVLMDFLNSNGVYKMEGDSRHLYEYPLHELEEEYARVKKKIAE